MNIFFLLDAYLWGFMYSLYKKSWTPSNRKAYLHNFVTLQCRFWWINPLNQNCLLILKHALFSIIQAVTFSNQGGFHLNLLVFPFVRFNIISASFQSLFAVVFTLKRMYYSRITIQNFLTKLGRHILSPFHMDKGDKMWRPSFVKKFCIVILL